MTHPFHPLRGRSFELLTYRKTWGEDRVFFEVDGRLRALPSSWTDVVESPVFVRLAAGRALFRPDDLLRLVELVDGLASMQKVEGVGVGGEVVLSTKLRRVCKDKNAANGKRRRSKRRTSRR